MWVLGVLAALSLWVVGSDLIAASVHHLVWTHTDSYFSGDQLQYLAWIRSSAAHGLVSDLFVLRATPADYLQPAILLSGLLVHAGVAPWLALMLWKPVGVIAIFLAARALAHHCLTRTFDRRVALVLALLYACATVSAGKAAVFGDMISVWQSWGYPFGLIGVALIVYALLAYARARDTGRTALTPGLLGLLAGTIHPWQGELMFGVLVLAELTRFPETRARLRATHAAGGRGWAGVLGRDPGLRLAAITLALVGLALAYYFALGHLDPVWRLGQARARHTYSSSAALIAAGPLLVFALLGYRGRPADFLELMLRMWIPVAVLIWVFSLTALGATPQHAVNGLPLVMAVLAVLGARRTGLHRLPRARGLAVLATGLGVVPGTVWTIVNAHRYITPVRGTANFVTGAENRALADLRADPAPGGVLTSYYLGAAVPGLTGRQTYLGDCLWSQPDCAGRARMVNALLAGSLTGAAARRFAAGTGARFILGDCFQAPAPVTRSLGGLVASVQRVGCATVWRLRAPAGGLRADAGAAWIPGNMAAYASVRPARRQ